MIVNFDELQSSLIATIKVYHGQKEQDEKILLEMFLRGATQTIKCLFGSKVDSLVGYVLFAYASQENWEKYLDNIKEEIEKLKLDSIDTNMCDACAGTGDYKNCMCGGSGKATDAVVYLRTELRKLEDNIIESKQLHLLK